MTGLQKRFLFFDHYCTNITLQASFTLPCFVLLKGKNQDNAAEQTGDGDEYFSFDQQHVFHKKYLSGDQEEGENDDDDLADEFLGLAFEEAEDGNEGKEDTDQRCHRVVVFIDRI